MNNSPNSKNANISQSVCSGVTGSVQIGDITQIVNNIFREAKKSEFHRFPIDELKRFSYSLSEAACKLQGKLYDCRILVLGGSFYIQDKTDLASNLAAYFCVELEQKLQEREKAKYPEFLPQVIAQRVSKTIELKIWTNKGTNESNSKTLYQELQETVRSDNGYWVFILNNLEPGDISYRDLKMIADPHQNCYIIATTQTPRFRWIGNESSDWEDVSLQTLCGDNSEKAQELLKRWYDSLPSDYEKLIVLGLHLFKGISFDLFFHILEDLKNHQNLKMNFSNSPTLDQSELYDKYNDFLLNNDNIELKPGNEVRHKIFISTIWPQYKTKIIAIFELIADLICQTSRPNFPGNPYREQKLLDALGRSLGEIYVAGDNSQKLDIILKQFAKHQDEEVNRVAVAALSSWYRNPINGKNKRIFKILDDWRNDKSLKDQENLQRTVILTIQDISDESEPEKFPQEFSTFLDAIVKSPGIKVKELLYDSVLPSVIRRHLNQFNESNMLLNLARHDAKLVPVVSHSLTFACQEKQDAVLKMVEHWYDSLNMESPEGKEDYLLLSTILMTDGNIGHQKRLAALIAKIKFVDIQNKLTSLSREVHSGLRLIQFGFGFGGSTLGLLLFLGYNTNRLGSLGVTSGSNPVPVESLPSSVLIAPSPPAPIVPSEKINEQSTPQNPGVRALPKAVSEAPLELKSRQDVDYSDLESLMKAKDWKQADRETKRLMLKIAKRTEAGYINLPSMKGFPCGDLRTIEELWATHSNGRFGFAVQSSMLEALEPGIVQKLSSPGYKLSMDIYERFGQQVEWRRPNAWKTYSELNFTSQSPKGHLPLRGLIEVPELGTWYATGLFSRMKACGIPQSEEPGSRSVEK